MKCNISLLFRVVYVTCNSVHISLQEKIHGNFFNENNMITIPEYIRDALREAYPKKAENVNNGLNKYLSELNSYITKSIMNSSGVYRYVHFHVPVDTLKRSTMRMQGKTYIHDWLKQNYPLFTVIEEGNNLTHKLSVIKLTTNATYQDPIVKYPKYTEYLEYIKLPTYDLDDMLDHDMHHEIFGSLFPELEEGDLNNPLFDYSPIDTVSLRGYIEWLPTAHKIEISKKQDMFRQARIINSIAKVTGGYLPQYKNKSVFGRTYYRGLSLQGTYKSLRYAALGECYQYDIRSSAITWKMKFIKDVDPSRDWRSSILFLEDKKGFVTDVYNEVFRGYKMYNSKTEQWFEISKEDATRRIKDVLNAISFGAKVTTGGMWYNEKGDKVTTAINDIIPDKELRTKFLNFWHIKHFIEDQKLLDEYLYQKYKNNPKILEVKELFDKKGNINRSKLNAFLYQQAETKIMNAVHLMIEGLGKTIIAKIHDAVIIDSKLSQNDKYEIETLVQEKFQILLWRLTLDQHNPYTYISTESKDTLTEHQQLIVKQEKIAKNYKSNWTTDINLTPTMEDMLYDFFKQEDMNLKEFGR